MAAGNGCCGVEEHINVHRFAWQFQSRIHLYGWNVHRIKASMGVFVHVLGSDFEKNPEKELNLTIQIEKCGTLTL